MPNRFFLNALKEGEKGLEGPSAGLWKDDSVSKDFLAKFAAAIYLTGQVKEAQVSHSVPSAFARPIQFDQALSEVNNPLHDALSSEWRGLMAVFGLQAWMGLNVSVKPYLVPADSEETSAVGTSGDGDLHLRTILRRQLPRPEAEWNEWWLVYCDEVLIGATSPWTIVYTPAQYQCPPSIFWQDKGLLTDPIRYFDSKGTGRPDELAILERWLELVEQEQRSLGDAYNWGMLQRLRDEERKRLQKKAGNVANALTAFRKDLARYRKDVGIKNLSPYPLVNEAPYKHFLVPPELKGPGVSSELLIQSSKVGDDAVILLSRSKLNAGSRIYGSVLVNQVNLDPASLPGPVGTSLKSRGGTPIPIPYVIAEEAFFPPKLVELKMDSAAMQRGTANFTLPLTPTFFKYYDHHDLINEMGMLTVTESANVVGVTLRLPLKGPGRNYLVVEKTYDRKSQVISLADGDGDPAFAMWPDYWAEDWRDNFAAYAWVPQTDRTDLRVSPLLPDGSLLSPETRNEGNQRAVRIWWSARPSLGFALTCRDRDSNQVDHAGILLRRELRSPGTISPEKEWDVAVDFGTSSTTVMVKRNGDIELLPLRGRTVFLTDAASDRKEAITKNLYPSEGAMPPFRTLLYDSNADVFGAVAFPFTLSFQYHPDESKPVANVKWGTQGGGSQGPLTQYLTGLVRYIMAEARGENVGKVKLRWSYPLSLPVEAFTAMSGYWSTVATTYSKGGMEVTVEPGISESEAVCRCLDAAKVLPALTGASLAIAVDIGGGSTDVGFWSGGSLVDQFSFKLAGNDVLDPRWVSYREFLPDIFRICMRKEMPDLDRKRAADRPAIYLNGLLWQAKDERERYFADPDPYKHPVPQAIHKGSASEPPWVHVRSLAYLFFTGIAYYLGLHTRMFIRNNTNVYIYIGGRGASLLTWITVDNKQAEKLLQDAFAVGVQLDQPADISVSPKFLGPLIDVRKEYPPLKHEVSKGLLCDSLGGKVERVAKTPIGEGNWKRDGFDDKWDTRLEVEDLGKLKPPSNNDGSYLEYFRRVLKKHAELNLDERLSKLNIEQARVHNAILQAARPSERVLQPVFAYELKELMDAYVEAVLGS